jgi:HD-like signal output (HDOD) protein
MTFNKQVGNATYNFNDIVKKIEDSGISTICRTINKFNEIINDDNVASKNKDLENLIKEDVSLSLAVLKTANSPLFRTKNRQYINTISTAINMIGWDTIYKIGMSLTVKGLVKKANTRTFANWMVMHAITISNISDIFLDSIKLYDNKFPNINSIYAYGLLHDIGAIGLLQTIERYQQDIMEIKLSDDEKNWSDAENTLYGFDHNMIGEQILFRSQLPGSFSVVARHHHSPDPLKYSATESKIITLIRLAQASFVDTHKFSEHEAFSSFNYIAEGNELIREYENFSDILKKEFEEQLSLTKDIYNEIKSTRLNNDFIKNISQQFNN